MKNAASHLQWVTANPAGVAFLDIETTGLSRYYDELTIVGYEIDGVYRAHIAGDDPHPLLQALRQAAAVVTFNGTLFDLPFLRKTFQEISLPEIHVDLRYAARRVGLAGGQKAIEKKLGITIRGDLDDMDGRGAVLLWHRYLNGDLKALRELIRYNHADVRGMTAILDHILAQSALAPDLFLEPPEFFGRFRRAAGSGARNAKLPSAARLHKPAPSFRSLFAGSVAEHATVVGIDLTGSEKRPSGFCSLRGAVAETKMLATDADIMAAVESAAPSLVSIDSPLSLPIGRTIVTDDDPGRDQFGIMRVCERVLKRRGINVYPCLLPSMQRLTQRGIATADALRKKGIPVIECYPGAAQDIMRIPRKGAGLDLLRDGLSAFGIRGAFTSHAATHDELDAITAAVVGSFFLAGKYEALDAPSEAALIIPDLAADHTAFAVGISGPMAAGKTELGRYLESRGFSYVRFSQVIDDLITAGGEAPNRESRQRVGWKVHKELGQRWLCERVLARVRGAKRIVIDGMRFPDDYAFLFESFGSRFLHLHLSADRAIRAERARLIGVDAANFEGAEKQDTESGITALGDLGGVTIRNEGARIELHQMAERAIVDSWALQTWPQTPWYGEDGAGTRRI